MAQLPQVIELNLSLNKANSMKYSLIKQHRLYDGFYKLDQCVIKHERFDGGTMQITRELVVRYDAACVLLFDPKRDELVLIRQFRVGAIGVQPPWLLEIVAGLVDTDETPEQVAIREAKEEANLQVQQIHKIAEYQPSPGGSSENIHLYVAQVDASNAGGVYGLACEHEDIKVEVVAKNQFYQWLQTAKIHNAAALIAGQWLMLNESWLKQQWMS